MIKHPSTLLLLVVLALSTNAFAQFTTVSGTVTDPNGLPYAFGTIASTIVASGTPTITIGGVTTNYLQPSQATGLDNTGKFTVRLADNTQVSPGGSTWSFTVCSAVGTVPFSFGKGPVCFTVTGVTISGASQNISATLTAAALALTATFSSTGITCSATCTASFMPVFTGSATVANSPIVTSAAQLNLGASGNEYSNQIGIITRVFNSALASCGGSNLIPSPVFGCMGNQFINNNNAATSAGVSAGISIKHSGSNFVAGTMGVGLSSQEAAGFSQTEERAGYFEAFESTITPTVTTRRGLYVFAANGTGNTTTTNEAVVAQSGSISGTNTNDFSLHVLAPASGGTLTTHAGVKVDAQTTGVELQLGPHVFSALPTCNATYEGSFAAVTDATSNTNGATVVGSGAHHVLAYCNSVNWLVVVGT